MGWIPASLPAGEERRRLLEAELGRMLPILADLGVRRVYLVGSAAKGRVHEASDLDLVIIADSKDKFLDRLERFYDALDPNVATDLFVYTPAEFEELKHESSFLREALAGGKVLYDARSAQGS